ncbi:MAG: exonuclease SbcCD subunit D [Bacilli bacterium]|jgi:exonuclease SbcD|nr:exonuclease SbcCD subunit D [Bacilli bacterium]MCH4210853.1 exonuclease SbcCD subunit D [Bacilli bacterium]MCH4228445.1 exonuclease SbcCD subunit D [Bacilli bacterium]MCI2054620.1 exonuclease SbcCD subunit D [Bacilli bacterium]
MRILQLSDLHLGKRLKEYSLIADQRYVLEQALDLIKEEKLDACFLCGDIYDSSVPSAEATVLYDEFLAKLHALGIEVFIISGNHDSADKLHFGKAVFEAEKIHIVTRVEESLTPIPLGDDVMIYQLPFIRSLDVNEAFETAAKGTSEAIKEVLGRMNIDTKKTNILLAHQAVFPFNGKLLVGGSEELLSEDGEAVGDVASVDASLFKDFDFVALGHIHKAQNVAKNARYAGSILKYHRDEASSEKSFTIINAEKKNVTYSTKPIHFLHDVVLMKGTLEEILQADGDKNAYVFALLDDKSLVEDPMAKLKIKYPYAAWVDYSSHESSLPDMHVADIEHVSKEKLFSDFYLSQNGEPLSEEQIKIVHGLLGEKEEK